MTDLPYGKPTLLLQLIRWLYQTGLLKRGAGRLLDAMPLKLLGCELVLVPTDIGSLVAPVRDHGARSILLYGRLRHERLESQVISKLLSNARTMFDVGANVGWYSLLSVSSMPPEATVVALEPDKGPLRCLEANGMRHPQMKVIAAAASDSVGVTTLFRSESSDLSSISPNAGSGETVPMTTLDAVWEKLGNRRIDFVKCRLRQTL